MQTKPDNDAPIKPIDIMTHGVKFTLGVCPVHNNATLTISDMDGATVLMIDMDPQTVLRLARDLTITAAQLFRDAPRKR